MYFSQGFAAHDMGRKTAAVDCNEGYYKSPHVVILCRQLANSFLRGQSAKLVWLHTHISIVSNSLSDSSFFLLPIPFCSASPPEKQHWGIGHRLDHGFINMYRHNMEVSPARLTVQDVKCVYSGTVKGDVQLVNL